jgi:hypothetical protein
MARGPWFLEFSLHVEGGLLTSSPVDLQRIIQVPLHTVEEGEAEKQAQFLFRQLRDACHEHDTEFFREYCHDIDMGDQLTLDEFWLMFEGESQKSKRKLDFETLVAPHFL